MRLTISHAFSTFHRSEEANVWLVYQAVDQQCALISSDVAHVTTAPALGLYKLRVKPVGFLLDDNEQMCIYLEFEAQSSDELTVAEHNRFFQ